MRIKTFAIGLTIVALSLAILNIHPAPADTAASRPSSTIEQDALARLVQEEVARQLPAAVGKEVKKQLDVLAEQAEQRRAVYMKAARANSLISTLQTLRSQLELYKIQHADNFPTMAQLSNWKNLVEKTDTAGNTSGRVQFGPYLQMAPVNAFTEQSNVVASGSATKKDGWTWDEKTGILRAVIPAEAANDAKGLNKDNFEIAK